MKMKILIVGAFALNTIFGHLCVIPMAYAQSMPMEHDEAMEMVMTPVKTMTPAVLTSSAHCKRCVHIQKEQPIPMTAGCAGHCLAKANDNVAAVTAASSFVRTITALPPALPTIIAFADTAGSCSDSTAPPLNTSLQRGIVLLE